jgi:hypothetical protein
MNWVFISQKMPFFIVTAVKTSNLTCIGVCLHICRKPVHHSPSKYNSTTGYSRSVPINIRNGYGLCSSLHMCNPHLRFLGGNVGFNPLL